MRTMIAVVLFLGGAAVFTLGMMLAIEGDAMGTSMVLTALGGFMFGAGGWTLFLTGRH